MASTLTFVFVLFAFVSCGQNNSRTLKQIDSICYSIDNRNDLFEEAYEGTLKNKRSKVIGHYETKYLSANDSLYRIINCEYTDKSFTTTYYYDGKQMIKATRTIKKLNTKHSSVIYSATYYVDKNHVIEAIGEKKRYSNADLVLDDGIKSLSAFYEDKSGK